MEYLGLSIFNYLLFHAFGATSDACRRVSAILVCGGDASYTCITARCAAALRSPAQARSEAMKLWEAAKSGDTTVVQRLLDEGADPNDPAQADQPANRTALHLAAAGDFAAVASLLLDAGASVDILNSVDAHPLRVSHRLLAAFDRCCAVLTRHRVCVCVCVCVCVSAVAPRSPAHRCRLRLRRRSAHPSRRGGAHGHPRRVGQVPGSPTHNAGLHLCLWAVVRCVWLPARRWSVLAARK